jgi:hypothetical protein
MSQRFRFLLAAVASVVVGATEVRAQSNPPDHYLCYQAGAGKTKKQSRISGTPIELRGEAAQGRQVRAANVGHAQPYRRRTRRRPA